ncbi:hypothetical protein ACFWYW_47010 [Nonomuraea sp. NPDC059023]|uniref:hypothetical protein n=1 Tax=Nonomuraea sp. NPDC059023 TaxID=3346706 RepID=UPI0036CDA80E
MTTLTSTGEAATASPPAHHQPACIVCSDPDPTILEDGRTACCNEDPVAYTCPDCHYPVYYQADGTEPDFCPHC